MSTIDELSLESYDGKRVVLRQSPWDDMTYPADLPHIRRELILLDGQLEMHSQNVGTGERTSRILESDEVERLYLDESGKAILDLTDSCDGQRCGTEMAGSTR